MKSTVVGRNKLIPIGIIFFLMSFIIGCGSGGWGEPSSDGVAPTITSTDNYSFTEGVAGTFTVTATGMPAPTFALTGDTLPSGITFDDSTGVLSGTPEAGTKGTYSLTITASNGVSPDAIQSFTLTVAGFTKLLGTLTTDFGEAVAVDTSGNVYVAGYTYGSLDGNTHIGSDYNMFLVKYDSSGVKQWTQQLGTTSSVSTLYDIMGIAVDTSGYVYVTGHTSGALDGQTSAGGRDMFLVKYDSDGTWQWTRLRGTSSDDYGNGVAVDTSGYVYVSGITGGSMDGNTSAGGNDMFLVKYDSDGTWQWTRQLGTSSGDDGNGVAVDTSGYVYVTGYTSGDLDGNTSAGGKDMFLVKYNSAGTKQWTHLLGTSLDEWGYGVAVDTSGNIYVSGSTLGSLGGSNAGDWDMFLAKYDSAGVYQWTQQLGGDWYDFGYSVAVNTSGDIYVSGGTLSAQFDGQTNAGNYDSFLVKYNSTGTKQWTRLLGGDSTDLGYGVAVASSGYIYMTGCEASSVFDGITNAGNYDMFLAKYDSNGVKQ